MALSSTISRGQILETTPLCTMAYGTRPACGGRMRPILTVGSFSRLCHLHRLVHVCLRHCHTSVRVWRWVLGCGLRDRHPALSSVLCDDQGKFVASALQGWSAEKMLTVLSHRSSVLHAGSEAKTVRTTADSFVAHIPVLGRESGKAHGIRRRNCSTDAG